MPNTNTNTNYNTELVNKKLKKWSNFVEDYNLPTWDRLPNIGLYMDQVITLLSQYLDYLPFSENKDQESFITANAINNYVRLGAMPAPVKKKYYRVHIAYLIIICVIKPALNISDITNLYPANLSEEEIEPIYSRFIQMHRSASLNLLHFLQDSAGTPQNDNDVVNVIITSAIATSLLKRFTEKTSALKGMRDEADLKKAAASKK